MKTNKIYKSTAVLFLSVITMGALNSCNTDNITDVQNKGAFDSENFYQNRDQAFQALVATYDPIGKYAAGFENMLTFSMRHQMIFTLEVGVIQMVQEFRDFLTTV